MTKKTWIEIYTDGACSGNPGPGGWGAVIFRHGMPAEEISGGVRETTNNRMEMLAVIRALESLKESDVSVRLYTDSQYVMKGMTEYLSAWKARGWRTASKKGVKNLELWKSLDALTQKKDIAWVWVEAHQGVQGNERADTLARDAIPFV